MTPSKTRSLGWMMVFLCVILSLISWTIPRGGKVLILEEARNDNRTTPPRLKRSPYTNVYLQLSYQVTKDLNVSRCWVCSLSPRNLAGGIPMISASLNTTRMLAPHYSDLKRNGTW